MSYPEASRRWSRNVISSISGSSSGYGSDLFGAQVVSKTLDYMNNQGSGSDYAITDKQSFGAAVVSKTLDYMNSGGSSGGSDMAQTYDFNKSVLSGYMSGIGQFADYKHLSAHPDDAVRNPRRGQSLAGHCRG